MKLFLKPSRPISPISFLSLGLLSFLLLTGYISKGDLLEAPARPGKDYALFIAVKDYEQWPDLRNPIKDAYAIAEDLKNHYNFETEILENPSQAQILSKLRFYQQKHYEADAQLLIFFTGHGAYLEGTAEGFFIPRDGKPDDPDQSSYLSHSRLEKAISSIPCRHILLAIDACYSGTFKNTVALKKGKFSRPGEVPFQQARQAFIARSLSYKSRLYLTSGGKERTPDGQDHSPFTTQFLTALRSFGGEDQILDSDELISYMKQATPSPWTGEFTGHEPEGDFLFVVDNNPIQIVDLKADLEAWEKAQMVNTTASYQTYLANWPYGEFHNLALQEIERLQLSALPRDTDGNIYEIAELDGRIWLASNLKFNAVGESWCYKDAGENCQYIGRVYTLNAAKKACATLGEGWRLPSKEEWEELAESYKKYYLKKKQFDKDLEVFFEALARAKSRTLSEARFRSEFGFGFKELAGCWGDENQLETSEEMAWVYLFPKTTFDLRKAKGVEGVNVVSVHGLEEGTNFNNRVSRKKTTGNYCRCVKIK